MVLREIEPKKEPIAQNIDEYDDQSQNDEAGGAGERPLLSTLLEG
jgi:hypothetical protein